MCALIVLGTFSLFLPLQLLVLRVCLGKADVNSEIC